MITGRGPAPDQRRSVTEPRRVPAEIRDVAFPVSARGYDRRAVDAYVIRLNRVIAELEATRSPQSVIERALERAKGERSAILERAHAAVDEMTAAARREADEMVATARAEAVDIVVNASDRADRMKAEAEEQVARASAEGERILAESRTEAADRIRRAEEEIAGLREAAESAMRELRNDTEAIWDERLELLADLRNIAARLRTAASADSADG